MARTLSAPTDNSGHSETARDQFDQAQPPIGAVGVLRRWPVSKLAGVGLTIAAAGGADAALSLFDLKSEVERLSQDAVVTLRNRITKLGRFRRVLPITLFLLVDGLTTWLAVYGAGRVLTQRADQAATQDPNPHNSARSPSSHEHGD
jgi:hypothetical protein